MCFAKLTNVRAFFSKEISSYGWEALGFVHLGGTHGDEFGSTAVFSPLSAFRTSVSPFSHPENVSRCWMERRNTNKTVHRNVVLSFDFSLGFLFPTAFCLSAALPSFVLSLSVGCVIYFLHWFSKALCAPVTCNYIQNVLVVKNKRTDSCVQLHPAPQGTRFRARPFPWKLPITGLVSKALIEVADWIQNQYLVLKTCLAHLLTLELKGEAKGRRCCFV